MNKIAVFWFLLSSIIFSQKSPFNRGVNLSGWFQIDDIRQIQFSKFDRTDFEQLKSLGVDVVRLPINLHFMTNGAPDYTIDPLFFFFLDQVIDWAEELQINLILDNHTFDVTVDTAPDIDQVLIPVWTQMAEHYKNRTNYIHYEILNEPHGIDDARWNEIQQNVIEAIREIDQKHTIVVGPAGWNSYANLDAMPLYNDDNLIYTFHFYDPFLFTHQGADWSSPSMESLAGVPFPYDADRMPQCPPDLIGTWIENGLQSYQTEGTITKVRNLLDVAIQFQQERNVPLFCGEFGVFIPNSPASDRAIWYNIVRTYLELYDISWTAWDYKGGFGLYEKDSNELFDYNLNVPLLNALGLNVPPQFDFEMQPDSTGFSMYNEYFEKNILSSGWTNGTIDFYNSDDPKAGQFCIYWTRTEQYDQIGFNFAPDKDISRLFSEDYQIDFWMKGDSPDIVIDIRFIDTKTEEPADHPWRMRYTINNTVTMFNNEWQHIQIPLKEFSEYGSWDNDWFDPVGDFDWKAIDRFEIVAEHKDMPTQQLWFDEIKIFNPNVSATDVTGLAPLTFNLDQNYPNPFNPTTIISFQLSVFCKVKIQISDILGREIETIVDEEKTPGTYKISFNGENLPSGVYFYKLTAGDFSATKKMILLR